MTKTKAWIHACRLRTLPLSLSGIILGSFVAKSKGFWDTKIFIFALLTTVLFQVLSNLANDLGDSQKGADNDGRIGPERAVQSGLISMKEMRSAVILLSVLSFVSAGTLIYFSSLNKSISFWLFYAVLAVFCVLAAITYTVGKRAYGYHGLGDFFVFIFFGFVSVVGVYHLYLSEFSFSTFQFENLLPASTIGFLSMAVLNLNNMRDRTNDANVGKRTLVVKLGGERAKLYHAFLILGGIACFTIYVFQFQSENKWMTLSLLPLIFLIAHLRKAMSIVQERNFDPELKKVALSAFALSVLFALAIVLNTSF
jgi:1,4-dihydroxy-2-naphthoate octaprenyltransferase